LDVTVRKQLIREGKTMKKTITVLVYQNAEYEEYIGMDNKKYISQDTTKKYTAPYNTVQKTKNWLKFKMIPFRTYKKDIERIN